MVELQGRSSSVREDFVVEPLLFCMGWRSCLRNIAYTLKRFACVTSPTPTKQ